MLRASGESLIWSRRSLGVVLLPSFASLVRRGTPLPYQHSERLEPKQGRPEMISLRNALSCGRTPTEHSDDDSVQPATNKSPIIGHSPTQNQLPTFNHSSKPSTPALRTQPSIPQLNHPGQDCPSSASVSFQPASPMDPPPIFTSTSPFLPPQSMTPDEERAGCRGLVVSPEETPASSSPSSPNLAVHALGDSPRRTYPLRVTSLPRLLTAACPRSQSDTTAARPRPARGRTARRSTRTRPRARTGAGR